MAPTRPSRRRGFTLVEAIATIVILAVVMGVASRLVHAGADAYTAGSVRAEMHAQLSSAMDRITSELREVRAAALALNVSGLAVACYDQENTALAANLSGASTAAIRRVELTLQASVGGVGDTLRTRVFLRCTVAGGAS